MAVAELELLGVFELRLSDGEAVELPGRKDRACWRFSPWRRAIARVKLAGLLWSDRGDAQARDSMEHALMQMRQSLMLDPEHEFPDEEPKAIPLLQSMKRFRRPSC